MPSPPPSTKTSRGGRRSDIIAGLLLGFSPAERGLVKREGEPVLAFPEDYPDRLRAAVDKAFPKN